MFCNKCESKAYEDSVFCHKCGVLLSRDEENAGVPEFAQEVDTGSNARFYADVPEFAPEVDIGSNAKFDIVLVEVASTETGADGELSEKARMAVAYVLFEDMIKKVNRGAEHDPRLRQQLQSESMKNADILLSNLPITIKKSVSKSEALFFKKRLAQYGVTVALGYCPGCGGSLDDISDKCISCKHAAIEFEVSDNDATILDAFMPKAAAQHSGADKTSTTAQTTMQAPKKSDGLQAPTTSAPNVDAKEHAKEKRKNRVIAILASAVAALIIAAVVIWYL